MSSLLYVNKNIDWRFIFNKSQFPDTDDTELLSPITSQPWCSAERRPLNNSDVASPISDALNIAASATSLSNDIQLCEKLMTEKHQFLVAMLDGMNQKVTSIADKIFTLEQRVDTIEKRWHIICCSNSN